MSRCPKCQKALEVITYEGKDLLQCPQCQGFWFTEGLFREVKQIGFAGLCAPAGAEIPAEEVQGSEVQEAPELACPDCPDQRLTAYNYAYSSDIQLHRCTQCKGIWADQTALVHIEHLLASYQESLEEAKAKALPLMMEVKQQFKDQEEAWEAERQKRKKQGLLGRLFHKKPQKKARNPMDILADIHSDNHQDQQDKEGTS